MPNRYGFSVARERLRVTGPAELFAGLLLIVMICWLVFPRDLVGVLRRAQVDAVTLSYTDNWLRAEPDDYALRLLLADRLIDMGLPDRARQQLDYVRAHSNDPQWRARQRWLDARLTFTQLMAIAPSQRRENPVYGQTQKAFAALDPGDLDREQLERYAAMAIDLGHEEAAVTAYHRIAESSDQPALWYRKSARLLLAQGGYRGAAAEYLRALDVDGNPDDARRDFLDAVATLQSGDLLGPALALARQHRGPFMDDRQVLYRLMNLALAAGNGAEAQFYAERLMRAAPSKARTAP